jgi:hypothetical protein
MELRWLAKKLGEQLGELGEILFLESKLCFVLNGRWQLFLFSLTLAMFLGSCKEQACGELGTLPAK